MVCIASVFAACTLLFCLFEFFILFRQYINECVMELIGILALYNAEISIAQTTVEELVSATAYFDLFLRSVTDPGLLRSLVRFLLEDNYDLCRILDSLIQRISSRSRVSH